MIAKDTVYVVDQDSSVRNAIEEFLVSFNLRVMTFRTGLEYAACARSDSVSCLIFDMHAVDSADLDLQRDLCNDQHPPIIFTSSYSDASSIVRAMKAGASDFLTKPFSQAELLASIDAALAKHRQTLGEQRELARVRTLFESLTPREQEVFALVVRGLLNKQAAAMLGITQVTLQIHRGNVMRKMRASSFAELVRMAVRLEQCAVDPGRPPPDLQIRPVSLPGDGFTARHHLGH